MEFPEAPLVISFVFSLQMSEQKERKMIMFNVFG